MDLTVNMCLAGLSTTALGLHLYLKPSHSQTPSTCSSSSATSSLTWIYLPAHLLALFSDWLQGPYVFQLYRAQRWQHSSSLSGRLCLLLFFGKLKWASCG